MVASNKVEVSLKRVRNHGKVSIEAMPMSCDTDLKQIPDPLPKRNIFFMLIGKPGSGKTNLMLNLLTLPSKFYHRKFDKVYIFSPSVHTMKAKLNIPKDQIRESLETFPALYEELLEKKKRNAGHHACIVIDDLTHEFAKQGNIPELIKAAQNRRHAGIALIIITQKLNKVPSEVRAHVSDVCWFFSNSIQEQDVLRKEFCDLKRDEWRSLVRQVFNDAHDFLYIKSDARMFKNFDYQIMLGGSDTESSSSDEMSTDTDNDSSDENSDDNKDKQEQ
ncbi:hypothetical protein SARC_11266 [Sphaeroforma arctica JP610]|uniref:Uncharacterized protein n=1 Tax=Sphaeroforma arctica JP610 TaxID=667725 RepID=A0A0L0FID2_9EUKA|nr:hypothetical protein SARC_11266 [Sphaeroforma arctica JP610]KNC76226.1 hypothetical protein SARC_11266 [Sphaeroforma arctica JP610]|eukprot:XP_014150128.1 hypothetical protein SARC_11266 [Sphaeroforma arctica JP610]